jgi:Yip1 domain
MSHLITIFLEPSKVFTELKEKPTWLWPVLTMVVVTMAMTLLYFMKVDSAWLIDHTLFPPGSEVSAKEKAKILASISNSTNSMMAIGATISVPITMAVMTILSALYFFIAAKVTGANISFMHGISLTAWAGMPMVLGVIVALIGAMMMTPQTSIESLNLLNLDPLLLQIPLDNPWNKLAKAFSLLSFWSWFLTALGWKTWGKTSWLEAIIVAIIPGVFFYGIFAAWIMITS